MSSQEIPLTNSLPPNGKPCRVCTDFRSWMHKKTSPASSSDLSNTSVKHSTTTTTLLSSTMMQGQTDANLTSSSFNSPWGSQEPIPPCPPDSIELGRHTWTFLHTFAAYYPDSPSLNHQHHATSMLHALSELYPCGYCADHLKEYLKRHPPKVDSYQGLNQWMCDLHNDVNSNLGKPKFDCSRVLERWKESLDIKRCG